MASEPGGRPYRGLLVDWGGVMTSDVFDTFRAFCESEGLAPDAIRRQRSAMTAPAASC